MDNISEKLLELIKTTPIAEINGRIANAEECIVSHVLESIASHLIANGVTIQQWIPVSEPPKKHGRYLAACENIETAQIRLYEGEWDSIQKVTHWMPTPTSPLHRKESK